MARLDAYLQKAKVVMVVQHSFDFVVTKCTKCLYLKNGRQHYFGEPKIAVEMYKEDL
jgi:ABC-type polysaccharide/polyol phosphate transport system ATPase subunit